MTSLGILVYLILPLHHINVDFFLVCIGTFELCAIMNVLNFVTGFVVSPLWRCSLGNFG